MIDPKQTKPIEEAYKELTGDPGITAVSDAAKGKTPMSDKETRMKEAEDENQEGAAHEANPDDYKEDTAEGESPDYCDPKCMDINEAYATLFEGLAGIMRAK